MKILANENIPFRSSQYPEDKGYDIVHIGLLHPSISDEDVMKIAIEEDRVILTFDRDYGDLVFKAGYNPPGVIYLRISQYVPQFPGELIHSIIESGSYSFEGQFTVINENSIRQRPITGVS